MRSPSETITGEGDAATAVPSSPIPIFSFANGEMGPLSSAVIRGLEKVTGQPRIRRLYVNYIDDDRPPRLFWQDAVARLGLTVNLAFDDGAYIPKSGPLLIIANHPFGVIDGLILCSEISRIRSDYKIITHEVLRQAPAVMHQILPIDFNESDAARATNLKTREAAMQQIKSGGALIMFPAGGISLAPKVIGPAHDLDWKTFAAKLALIPGTTILPVFFGGQNSTLYMAARKLSQTLGYSLMFREIARRIGSRVDVTIRRPIQSASLKRFANRGEVTEHLRAITYGTSGN